MTLKYKIEPIINSSTFSMYSEDIIFNIYEKTWYGWYCLGTKGTLKEAKDFVKKVVEIESVYFDNKGRQL